MTEFFYFRSVPFVKQLKEQGVKADFVACSEAGTTADWADETKGAGAVGNNVITFDYLPAAYTGGGSEEFRADFKAEYGRDPGFLEAAGYAEVRCWRRPSRPRAASRRTRCGTPCSAEASRLSTPRRSSTAWA